MSRLTTAPSLAAAAVLLTALLAGCAGDSDGNNDAAPSDASTPSDTSSPDVGTTDAESPDSEAADAVGPNRELTVASAPAGRCMVPNVDNLRAQDTAFAGVVTSIVDDTVTLEVTEAYKGEMVETATVTAPSSQTLQDLLVSVDFQQGQTYLVSSLDGKLSLCGLSGPQDDALSALYEQAYAG